MRVGTGVHNSAYWTDAGVRAPAAALRGARGDATLGAACVRCSLKFAGEAFGFAEAFGRAVWRAAPGWDDELGGRRGEGRTGRNGRRCRGSLGPWGRAYVHRRAYDRASASAAESALGGCPRPPGMRLAGGGRCRGERRAQRRWSRAVIAGRLLSSVQNRTARASCFSVRGWRGRARAVTRGAVP